MDEFYTSNQNHQNACLILFLFKSHQPYKCFQILWQNKAKFEIIFLLQVRLEFLSLGSPVFDASPNNLEWISLMDGIPLTSAIQLSFGAFPFYGHGVKTFE